jgi:L-fuconolactonase
MRVDAHHHLWHYTPEDYSWIDDAQKVLRQDFLPADLEPMAAAAGVQATVVVQARQTLEETRWLLDIAAQSSLIRGVVGWIPFSSERLPELLEDLRQNPLLRGLRHVVQGEPTGFLNSPHFNRGISCLRGTGLVYDILIFPQQLAEATRFVDRHPGQSFVLDHIAKPDIRHNEFAPWNTAVQELARRDNVTCKLSGMVTEADWNTWTPAQLQPYFDTILEAFGPSRLMAGSDWPVLTVASNYAQWWQTIEDWIAPLSPTERAQIEGLTACRIYGITPDPLPPIKDSDPA